MKPKQSNANNAIWFSCSFSFSTFICTRMISLALLSGSVIDMCLRWIKAKQYLAIIKVAYTKVTLLACNPFYFVVIFTEIHHIKSWFIFSWWLKRSEAHIFPFKSVVVFFCVPLWHHFQLHECTNLAAAEHLLSHVLPPNLIASTRDLHESSACEWFQIATSLRANPVVWQVQTIHRQFTHPKCFASPFQFGAKVFDEPSY